MRLERARREGAQIESESAWLAAVTTRLAIDHLRSARVRRERYVGPWLPEPLVGDSLPGPAEHAELADSLSQAFLLAAVDEGDLDALEGLLTADAVLYSDGGGKTVAARRPIHGAERIARFLTGAARKCRALLPGLTQRRVTVNGQPGRILFAPEGRPGTSSRSTRPTPGSRRCGSCATRTSWRTSRRGRALRTPGTP